MQPHLKPYLPRSLFGRAALILIVPIVTIQLVVSIVFIQRHFEGVTRQMTRGVTIELEYLLSEVASAASLPEAQARAGTLAQGLGLDVAMPATGPPAAPDQRGFWDWSGREVITSLRERLPSLVEVDLRTNDRQVQMLFETAFGPMAVSLERRRVSASNPHQLLVLMMVASVVLTLISYVFLRNQLSPISRLAAASEAFGRGQLLPYRPRGATEVRIAGHAFLDMRARIERQIEQRTLLLSGVSHDLRTPLTRMKLGLSLLPVDEDTAALSGDVVEMERLVDEFLAFARGDAMEETERVNPASLVARAVENAQRAGQAVSFGGCEGDGLLALRPQAILRALDNLIGNAVRYGSKVVVSLAFTERTVRLTVEDDGPGIPKDRRDEALQPFVRLDGARNPNAGGGVGLGLSIAADIARSHGGSLRLGSSADLGGLRVDLVLSR
jgi:two-component system osmolarity sensor histidine kinase EnvZ